MGCRLDRVQQDVKMSGAIQEVHSWHGRAWCLRCSLGDKVVVIELATVSTDAAAKACHAAVQVHHPDGHLQVQRLSRGCCLLHSSMCTTLLYHMAMVEL